MAKVCSLPPILFERVDLPGGMFANAVEKTMGKRVSLHYDQHRGIPFACFGDTEYFITGVTPAAQ